MKHKARARQGLGRVLPTSTLISVSERARQLPRGRLIRYQQARSLKRASPPKRIYRRAHQLPMGTLIKPTVADEHLGSPFTRPTPAKFAVTLTRHGLGKAQAKLGTG